MIYKFVKSFSFVKSLLPWFFTFIIVSCSSVGFRFESTYRIIDWNRIEHLYKESMDSLRESNINDFTKQNELIQYCGIHYDWEVIHPKWGMYENQDGNQYGWYYRVIPDK